MTKEIRHQENGETIEVTAITEWPGGQWMSEIYSPEGWLLWFVGYFGDAETAYNAALDSNRR